MFGTVLFGIAILSAQTSLKVGPSVPPGAHAAFAATFLGVQRHLEAGDFDAASKLALKLPKKQFSLHWEDKDVRAQDQVEFRTARDAAISEWKRYVPGLEVIFLNQRADVAFSFQPTLPPNADSAGPAGAVFFDSDAPTDPRLEVVLALRRGGSQVPITKTEIRNEVTYSIGRYLGLERTYKTNSCMDRGEGLYAMEHKILNLNTSATTAIFKAVDDLQKSVRLRERLTPAVPTAVLEPRVVDLGYVKQGDRPTATLTVTNTGNADLNLTLVPDCGCFAIKNPQTIAAGSTGLVTVTMSTRDFIGPQDKAIYFYTSDPERSVIKVPFKVMIQPKYRLMRPESKRVFIAEENGLVVDYYLFVDDPKFEIKSATVAGVVGMADVEPWGGKLADPEMGEGSKVRAGYHIKVLLSPNIPTGRALVNLLVETNDPDWPTLIGPFEVQRGIAAFPSAAYLGDMVATGVSTTVTFNRPGKPFKITAVQTSHPFLKASFVKQRAGDEFFVTLRYVGGAPVGDFDGWVKIATNDPKQPQITVPVLGVVK